MKKKRILTTFLASVLLISNIFSSIAFADDITPPDDEQVVVEETKEENTDEETESAEDTKVEVVALSEEAAKSSSTPVSTPSDVTEDDKDKEDDVENKTEAKEEKPSEEKEEKGSESLDPVYTSNNDGTHKVSVNIPMEDDFILEEKTEDCEFDENGICAKCGYEKISVHEKNHICEYEPNGDGTHNFACTENGCKETGTEECEYDENGICLKCLAKKPVKEITFESKSLNETCDGIKITVFGDMPEGTKLSVKKLPVEETQDMIDDYVIVANFDISLIYDDGKEYEPEDYGKKVRVLFENLDSLDGEELQVIHITDDNEIIPVGSEINTENGETSVSFETESFSTYAVGAVACVCSMTVEGTYNIPVIGKNGTVYHMYLNYAGHSEEAFCLDLGKHAKSGDKFYQYENINSPSNMMYKVASLYFNNKVSNSFNFDYKTAQALIWAAQDGITSSSDLGTIIDYFGTSDKTPILSALSSSVGTTDLYIWYNYKGGPSDGYQRFVTGIGTNDVPPTADPTDFEKDALYVKAFNYNGTDVLSGREVYVKNTETDVKIFPDEITGKGVYIFKDFFATGNRKDSSEIAKYSIFLDGYGNKITWGYSGVVRDSLFTSSSVSEYNTGSQQSFSNSDPNYKQSVCIAEPITITFYNSSGSEEYVRFTRIYDYNSDQYSRGSGIISTSGPTATNEFSSTTISSFAKEENVSNPLPCGINEANKWAYKVGDTTKIISMANTISSSGSISVSYAKLYSNGSPDIKLYYIGDGDVNDVIPINLDYNGGSGVVSRIFKKSDTLYWDEACNLPIGKTDMSKFTSIPTKSGSAFLGFNTASNGSGFDTLTYASGTGTWGYGYKSSKYYDAIKSGTTYNVKNEATWYAQWDTAYTVTYDGNGNTSGSVPTDTTKYSSGNTVTVKGNTGSLKKTGFEFGGWKYNSTNYNPGDTVTVGTSNITFKAIWNEIPKYKVTYNGNGNTSGTVPTDATEYPSGDTAYAKSGSTLVKTGYTFDGWNTTSSGTGTDYAVNDAITMTSNKTLYAKWKINQYTITFQDWDGTVISTNTYTHGATVTKPADPTRAGYTFDKWSPVFVGTATEDKVYTATYNPIPGKVTITYKDYDGTVLKSKVVTENTSYKVGYLPSDTVYYYEAFTGNDKYTHRYGYVYTPLWIDEGGNVLDYDTTKTATVDTEYTAYYLPLVYKVTYVDVVKKPGTLDFTSRSSSGMPIDTHEYKEGDTVVLPSGSSIVFKDEYNTLDKSNIAWYGFPPAKYADVDEVGGCYIGDVCGFGTLLPGQSFVTDYHMAFGSILNPSYKSFDYTGVDKDNDGSVDRIEVNIEINYYCPKIRGTVKFLESDAYGSSEIASQVNIESGTTISVPTDPTHPGVVFDKWSPALPTDGKAHFENAGDVLTFVATYKPLFTYTLMDAFDYPTTTPSYIYGETDKIGGPDVDILLMQPQYYSVTHSGYKFREWTINPDGTGITSWLAGKKRALTSDFTLYAQWDKLYTIKFVNHDDSLISSKDYVLGDIVSVPSNPSSYNDSGNTYVFKGWDKAITPVTGNMTYKAVFEKKSNTPTPSPSPDKPKDPDSPTSPYVPGGEDPTPTPPTIVVPLTPVTPVVPVTPTPTPDKPKPTPKPKPKDEDKEIVVEDENDPIVPDEPTVTPTKEPEPEILITEVHPKDDTSSTPPEDNLKRGKLIRNIRRTVIAVLCAGAVAAAIFFTGFYQYLWMLLLTLFRKRWKWNGMFSDEINKWVQVKNSDADAFENTMQDIANKCGTVEEYITKITENGVMTLLPYNTQMTVMYSDGNSEPITIETEPDESRLFEILNNVGDTTVVKAIIYNDMAKFEYTLEFNFKK